MFSFHGIRYGILVLDTLLLYIKPNPHTHKQSSIYTITTDRNNFPELCCLFSTYILWFPEPKSKFNYKRGFSRKYHHHHSRALGEGTLYYGQYAMHACLFRSAVHVVDLPEPPKVEHFSTNWMWLSGWWV